jgi:2-methylcitrate dehydratase PrpD
MKQRWLSGHRPRILERDITVGDETRTVAAFAAETSYSDLPGSIVDKSKLYLLDTLACGFIGSQYAWAEMVESMARDAGGNAQASLFNREAKVSAGQGAFVNGVMIGGFECEHVGHSSHPSGTITPAALAAAELQGATGKDLLTALIVGYETVCRIGSSQAGGVELERGFHTPATNGPFGATVASGNVFGFDSSTIANAMGIAGSHSSGLIEFAWNGEMTKRIHLGRASQYGLESALLAGKGFTGPATILEGPFGYLRAFANEPKPERLTDGLGETWLMDTMTIKAYPCHVTSQAIVAALQRFKRESPIDPASVDRLHIRSSKRLVQDRYLLPEPTSMMGAQYSLPFSTAVAVVRDLDDPSQFNESILSDPAITRLAQLATWGVDPEIDDRGQTAKLDIRIDGKEYTLDAKAHKGSVADPAEWDDIVDKFRQYSANCLDQRQQDRLIQIVDQLDQHDDLEEFFGLIRAQ